MKDTIGVRLLLENKWVKKFNTIKDHYGVESNAEVVRILITKEYRRITEEVTNENQKIR